MRPWLDFAEGPLFRFAFAIMVLGLLRLVVLSIAGIIKTKQATPDQSTNVGAQILNILKWMSPLRWLTQNRSWYTAMSFLFHIGLILVPIFLLSHVALWERGIGWDRSSIGFGWPTIPTALADGLTLLTIVTGLALLGMRAGNKGSRALSQAQDWLLTPLCVVIFVTGFLAAHPTHNPFGYNATRLVHVLTGNLILILMPFTKLAHVVLFPFTQALWDISWKFVPGVGEKVRLALGHQDKPI